MTLETLIEKRNKFESQKKIISSDKFKLDLLEKKILEQQERLEQEVDEQVASELEKFDAYLTVLDELIEEDMNSNKEV